MTRCVDVGYIFLQAHAMLRTIKHVKPERFVLENVSGMKAHGCLDTALEHMATELLDYTITHFELTPNMFGVCLLRPRIYFIGVRTNQLLGNSKDELQRLGRSFINNISCPVGADFITFLSRAQDPKALLFVCVNRLFVCLQVVSECVCPLASCELFASDKVPALTWVGMGNVNHLIMSRARSMTTCLQTASRLW